MVEYAEGTATVFPSDHHGQNRLGSGRFNAFGALWTGSVAMDEMVACYDFVAAWQDCLPAEGDVCGFFDPGICLFGDGRRISSEIYLRSGPTYRSGAPGESRVHRSDCGPPDRFPSSLAVI